MTAKAPGSGGAVKRLRSAAQSAANTLRTSWEHYLRMLADSGVRAVEIDLLRGTILPPAFAIPRNEILARRLQDQVVRADRALDLALRDARLILIAPDIGGQSAAIDIVLVTPSRRYEARFVETLSPQPRVAKISECLSRPGESPGGDVRR